MNREMFVRMATTVLHRMGVPEPQDKAEAIACQMDIFAAVMGEAPAPAIPAMQTQQPLTPPRPAFPAPNPEALAPAHELAWEVYPEAATAPPPAPKPTEPSLIVTDLRMPEPGERRAVPKPQEKPKPNPVGHETTMEAAELSLHVQRGTPPTIACEVPMEDGSTRRLTFARDVLTQHGDRCVLLQLYPANASKSMREATEVQTTIHVEEWPLDLSAVMRNLVAQAIEAVRPKPAPGLLPVRPFGGPILHQADPSKTDATFAEQAAQLSNLTQATFKAMG